MGDCIMDFRKAVGRRPLLQCGASVIVEKSAGEVLLEQRTDNGCRGYPGGTVELDEPAEDAAKRELYGETGLTALSLELFGVLSGAGTHHVCPNGDEASNADIVYICRRYTGRLAPQESEVSRLCFVDPENFPENISPSAAAGLKAYAGWRMGKRANSKGASLAGPGPAHKYMEAQGKA